MVKHLINIKGKMTGSASRSRRNKIRGQAGEIQRDIRAASILIEVRDARVPHLSGMVSFLGKQKTKFRAVVLTKADLACPLVTQSWIEKLNKEGIKAIAVDLNSGKKDLMKLKNFLKSLAKEKKSAFKLARFGIVGLPNVGKSTLINRVIGKTKVRTGDKPGITRGKQWVRVAPDVVILDTPGVIQLFSGLEKQLGEEFFKLTLCNVVPAGQFCSVTIATEFLAFVVSSFSHWPVKNYFHSLFSSLIEKGDIETFFDDYSNENGLLGKGGVPDLAKASVRLVSDFRKGKLGRISLEAPEEYTGNLWAS